MLKYTPTRNKPGPVARSDVYPPGRGNQCISRLFYHTGKRKFDILCSGNNLLPYLSQAACPIKHMVCL